MEWAVAVRGRGFDEADTLASSGDRKDKVRRRERFVGDVDAVNPWSDLLGIIHRLPGGRMLLLTANQANAVEARRT